jgi:imidazole glycerol-phosphate synthase subunit HisH
MKVVVVDSGVGNIPNAMRGLVRAGAEPVLCAEPENVRTAGCIVLPGVGAFPPAMARLCARGLDEALRDAASAGAAILGICLGHQLLFDASEEFGETPGLGLLPGRVVALPAGERVPHMGWSCIAARRGDPLVAGLDRGAWMFFVHSFAAVPANGDVVATVAFGTQDVCAIARRGRVCGVQFHPEKSGAAGARLIANFLALAGSKLEAGSGARDQGSGPLIPDPGPRGGRGA